MGYEDRKREQAEREKNIAEIQLVDRMIGPVLAYDVHRGKGCPKCGAASGLFIKAWCWGARDGFNGPCQTIGGHLHGRCGQCAFQWKEEALDAELNREQLVEEASSIIRP